MPTAERAARPAASARPGASTSRPSSAASAWATASASLVPEPRPTCCGIASTTRKCAPPSSPSASRQRRANVNARSASAPSADSSSARSASSTTAGRLTDTPSPPKRRAPSPATASMPRCSRAGATTRTPISPRSEIACGLLAFASSCERLDYVVHRLALAWAAGLVHEHLQAGQFGADLVGVEHARPRGEDRGLEDRVARPVQAEELTAGAATDDDGADPGALAAVVDLLYAHLTPRARIVQHRALN